MDKETEIDIVFYPSGEIRTISYKLLNKLFEREENIESINLAQKSKDRNLLGIRWDNEFNEWTISDIKLRLFIELTEVKYKSIS